MPTSNPFRTHTPSIVDEDGESLDSIPWDALDTLREPSDHRRWYLLAAGIVALAIAVSAFRGLAAPMAVVASPGSTVPPPVAASSVPPVSTTVPTVVTEADLMAIDPHLLASSAAAYAEAAATEYFSASAEGIWADVEFPAERSTFVEYATAVEVRALSPARFEVVVAVSVLDAADGEPFIRRPVRGVAMIVEATEGRFRAVDLPTPAHLPFGSFTAPAMEPVPVDAAVVESVREAATAFGTPAPDSVEFGVLDSGDTRAVTVVVDEAGIGWPMAFAVERSGPAVTQP